MSDSQMDRTQRVADIIGRSAVLEEFVRRRNAGSAHEEAWEIATGLTDILESAERLAELTKKLATAGPESVDVEDVLHAVGEEYRHMLYHIQNTKYFAYVQPNESD